MKQYQKIRIREIAEGKTLETLNKLYNILEDLEETKEQIDEFKENIATASDEEYIIKYYKDMNALQYKIYNIIDEYLKKGLEK